MSTRREPPARVSEPPRGAQSVADRRGATAPSTGRVANAPPSRNSRRGNRKRQRSRERQRQRKRNRGDPHSHTDGGAGGQDDGGEDDDDDDDGDEDEDEEVSGEDDDGHGQESIGGEAATKSAVPVTLHHSTSHPTDHQPAPPPTNSGPTSGRRPKSVVQAPEDERLMRAVVLHGAQLADATALKTPVWNAIAALCGGRFPSGRHAAGKVIWLQLVWRDPKHEQHAQLTAPLAEMIKQYTVLMGGDDTPPKKRQKQILTDPARVRRARLLEQQRLTQQATGTSPTNKKTSIDGKVSSAARVARQLPPPPPPAEEDATDGLSRSRSRPKDAWLTVKPAMDELVLQLVLEKRPSDAEPYRERPRIWREIIMALNDERIQNSNAASRRVWWLKSVYDDPTHVEHAKLTPTLRELLAQYSAKKSDGERDGSSAAGSSAVSTATTTKLTPEAVRSAWIQEATGALVANASGAPTSDERARPVSPVSQLIQQANDKRQQHADAGQSDGATSTTTPRLATASVEELQSQPQPQPQPTAKKPVREEWLTVKPKLDEAVMRLVLEKRPSQADPYSERPRIWKEIIAELKDKRIQNSNNASRRVRWLKDVFENPSRAEHVNLTPALRVMMAQYCEVLKQGDKRPGSASGAVRTTTATPTPTSATAKPVVANGAAKPAVVVNNNSKPPPVRPAAPSQAEKEPAAKAVSVQSVPPAVAVAVATPVAGSGSSLGPVEPTRQQDDVLLYEILRTRPFEKTGDGTSQWERVRETVNRRIGCRPPLFPTIRACMARMTKLLNAVRRPQSKKNVRVTRAQLEILELIHILITLRTKWPAMKRDRTDDYHELMTEINAVLEKTGRAQGLLPEPQQQRTELRTTTPTAIATPVRTLQDVGGEEEKKSEGQDLGPPETAERSGGPGNKRMRPETKEEELPRPVSSPGSSRNGMLSEYTVPRHEMRSLAATTPTTTTTATAAATVRQLTLQASKLEKERLDHASAFRAMVRALDHERTTQRRASRAQLQAIEQEREDRKAEFETMISLVAHAAAMAHQRPVAP